MSRRATKFLRRKKAPAIPPDGVLDEGRRTYMTGVGQILVEVHTRDQCLGRTCVLHDPSDHPMRGFPTNYRFDRGLMERICPHGVGHPDPDDLEFQNLAFPKRMAGVHGCDGCCVPGFDEEALAEVGRAAQLKAAIGKLGHP